MEGSRKLSTALEITLGLLPVTFILLPILAAGSLATVIVIATKLTDSSEPLLMRFQSALEPAPLVLWILAGFVGVGSVWILALASAASLQQKPVLRRILAAGFCSGIIAAAAWFYTMARAASPESMTWLVWLVILAGPMIVGLRHLRKLLPAAPKSG